MLRAYKYRIYPTKEQEVLLNKTFVWVRVIWNSNVATFNTYYRETNTNPTFKSSTEIKSEYGWMSEVSASALQQKEIDFKTFRKNYFSKNRKSKIGRCSFFRWGAPSILPSIILSYSYPSSFTVSTLVI